MSLLINKEITENFDFCQKAKTPFRVYQYTNNIDIGERIAFDGFENSTAKNDHQELKPKIGIFVAKSDWKAPKRKL